MPIACQCKGCGSKFRAPEKLVGKRVKCPKCSVEIRVPNGRADSAAQTTAEQGPQAPISVVCGCGKKFRARRELAGKRAKCPACEGALTIPAARRPVEAKPATVAPSSNGLDLDGLLAAEAASAALPSTPLGQLKPRKQAANTKLMVGLGAGGGGFLLLLLLIAVLWPSGGDGGQVVSQPASPGRNRSSRCFATWIRSSS